MRVGILGLGRFLPEEVRRNDYWPTHVIEKWMEARRQHRPPAPTGLSEIAKRVLTAMAAQAEDPFSGTVERRVMSATMTATEMETSAAREAIAHAGIDPADIGLLLVHTAVPEYLLSNTAAVLHHALGLPTLCMAMQVEASAYSFMMQLTVAEQMIKTGRVRYALLVQSSAVSRLLDIEDPGSPWFGDAATAVVVGAVATGGLLASVHRTDGRFPRTLIASVRDARWYDDGPVVLYPADPAGARKTFTETVDRGKEVIDQALAEAGHRADEVDFFGVHQGAPWLRAVAQDALGLSRARAVDIFTWSGYLFAASIPLVLATAHRDGLLHDGDLVVLFGGGTGATFGATVLRWSELSA